ncbi:MAG: hypothetical protein HY606_12940 [Planctomycetes bacterium]|nr:hypothetical protein [Planctomycetota bacterium]
MKSADKIKWIFFALAAILGSLQAWAFRYYLDQDAISYLDIADAVSKGNWGELVNGYWSPLFSILSAIALFIFQPAYYSEILVVRSVDFAIFIATFFAFEFMLKQMTAFYRKIRSAEINETSVTVFYVFAYTLFLWTSLKIISVPLGRPDMLVALFMYLATALLLKIQNGSRDWRTFAIFGVILGLGYLSKTFFFQLAILFLILSVFAVGNVKMATGRILLSGLIFLCISAPFVIALSAKKGYATIGDSPRLNYLLFIDDYPWGCAGELPANAKGTLKNPVKKIYDNPRIFSYELQEKGSVPFTYDPTYWCEGAELQFNLGPHLKRIYITAVAYCVLLLNHYPLFIAAVLTIILLAGVKSFLKYLKEGFLVLFVPLTACLMYLLVYIESRFVGSFLAIIFLVLFLKVIHLTTYVKWLKNITIAVLIVIIIKSCLFALNNMREITALGKEQLQITSTLREHQINKAGNIRSFSNLTWARLSKTQIVAEIFDADKFWAKTEESKTLVYSKFKQCGAEAIIAKDPPEFCEKTGWQRIDNTDHYIYFLAN